MIAKILYILDGLLLLQGLGALAEGIGFLRFVRRSVARKPDPQEELPCVSVIAPCKGADPGLDDNIDSVFDQDYPEFEVVFVVADGDDPAARIIERAIDGRRNVKSRLVIAGQASGRSEKVNNLLAAVRDIDVRHRGDGDRALVFFDSDSRPPADWLRSLVAPLKDPSIGAATGYRWYLPLRGGVWSALLSAWNATVASTLGAHGRNFVWGGSTAILKSTFDRIGVVERWQHAASDDYAMTSAIQDAGLRIRFVPRCLLISKEHTRFRALLEFTTRQVIITRVYRPRAWWVGMVSYSLFNLGFWGSLLFAYATLKLGPPHVRPALHAANPDREVLIICGLVGWIYLLGCAKGVTRWLAALKALPNAAADVRKLWWAYCVAWPLVSLLFLFNFVRSATTRRIRWRGVDYDLCSPQETIIL